MRTPLRQRPAAPFRYSPLIAALACVLGPQAFAAPTVVNNNPAGTGSLADAITLANGACGASPQLIDFAGSFTIGVSSPLPEITCANVEINAGTNTVIIDGSGLFSSGCGLTASSASTRIVGLEVRNFTYGGSSYGLCGAMEAVNNNIHNNVKGLFLYGSGSVINGNQIHGNQYGIYDTDGGSTIVDNDVYSNNWDGIRLFNGGTVGGASAAQGNRIHGNDRDIVSEDNSESGPLTISNNLIGTDGVTPNGSNSGIELYQPYQPYVISNNVVVAQSDNGISIWYSNAAGTISGNTVGGAGSLGNSVGINIYYSYGGPLTVSNNTVTGNIVGVRMINVGSITLNNNVVDANTGDGLYVSCSDGLMITANRVGGNALRGMNLQGLTNSTVRDNLVGTPNGGTEQGNGFAGIWVDGTDCYFDPNGPAFSDSDLTPKVAKVLGGANNLFEGNTVAFNGDNGMVVLGTGHAIRGSSSPSPHGGFHSNDGKAINLNYYGGPAPANNGQASPVLTSAQASAGSTVINFTLASLPTTTFLIDFYGNIEPQSATPDGRNYLGSVTVTTDGTGNLSNGTATFTGTHTYIVATATGPDGTSELSQAIVTAAANEGQLPLPAGIDLGTTTLHGSPLTKPLVITNTGNANVDFTTISATTPFEVSHNCPRSLAPGAACTASISFPPLAYGNTTGQLTVGSNAAGGNRFITLLATVSGVNYGITPTVHSFGRVPVGSESPPRSFEIRNDGSNAIPLSGVDVSGPYVLKSYTCGASLLPGSSCSAEVAFKPVVEGNAGGLLAVQVGVLGAPPAQSVLSGNGTQGPGLSLLSSIDFGTIDLGSEPSFTRAVEIRNSGNATLTFSTSLSGPFTGSGDCGSSLAPGAACNLLITFAPTAAGAFAGNLTVISNAPGGTFNVPIAAVVRVPPRAVIRLDASNLNFGDRMVGTPSGSQRVTVRNIGGVSAQLGVVPPTRDYQVTSQCGPTLPAGASCTADVVFRPLATGPRTNRLEFTSDAAGSPYGVDLTGRGCSPPRPRQAPNCN